MTDPAEPPSPNRAFSLLSRNAATLIDSCSKMTGAFLTDSGILPMNEPPNDIYAPGPGPAAKIPEQIKRILYALGGSIAEASGSQFVQQTSCAEAIEPK